MDKINYIPAPLIRQMFNESQYPQMILDGRLIPELLRDSPLKNPRRCGEPPGSRGQLIRYRNKSGQWLVEIFQYLRPDGTIGASGRPDPKRLRIGNTIFIAETQRHGRPGGGLA